MEKICKNCKSFRYKLLPERYGHYINGKELLDVKPNFSCEFFEEKIMQKMKVVSVDKGRVILKEVKDEENNT